MKVGGIGKSAIHAMPPDQTIGAWLAEPPAAIIRLPPGFDAGVDAPAQILLDRLGDTRLRIGIHRIRSLAKPLEPLR